MRASTFALDGDFVNDGFYWVGWKTADSTDAAGGNYTVSDPADMAFMSFSDGDDPVFGGLNTGTGTTATAPTVSSGGSGGCLETGWYSADTNFSAPNPSGGTLRENFGGTSGVSTDHEIWSEDGASTPTGTRTHGLGSSDWFAWSVFVPTAGPGTPDLDPPDNSTGVSVNVTLGLNNFGEAVEADTGNITIKRTSDDATIETIDITDTGKVTFSSNDVSVNPSTTLDYVTEYYVLVDSTAILGSVSGVHYAGISVSTEWSFQTEIAPSVGVVAWLVA